MHNFCGTSWRVVLAAAVAAGSWTGISGQTSSSANSAQVTRIHVFDVGIYATGVQSQSAPNQQALPVDTVINKVVAKTREVPLKLGVQFGFHYKIVGAPNGAPVQLRWVTIFPPAGLHNPTVDHPIYRNEGTVSRHIGETRYNGTGIDHDWAMVPGDWTLEIWYGDQKLASETFTVRKIVAAADFPLEWTVGPADLHADLTPATRQVSWANPSSKDTPAVPSLSSPVAATFRRLRKPTRSMSRRAAQDPSVYTA